MKREGKRSVFFENTRRVELFVQIVYSFYYAAMIARLMVNGSPQWILIVSTLLIFASWTVLIGKYLTYTKRAVFCSICIYGATFLFSLTVDSVITLTIQTLSLVIIMAFYRDTRLFFIPSVFYIVMTVTSALTARDDFFSSNQHFYVYLVYLFNVFISIGIMSFLIRKVNEVRDKNNKLIRELEIANSGRDDFIANVSHEIRTPINTIVGMSELIVGEDMPEAIKDELLSIQVASRNLISVVTDVLDYSELQGDNVEINNESYDISKLIEEILMLASAQKAGKKIEIVVNCDPTIPKFLSGDVAKIKRVILNLINNAVKFTNEGCITIDITYRREFYGINLGFAITDTGIGMSPESIEQLYTSFNQVDSSRERQEGGIGLGLAISHFLIDKMGGTLSVQSVLGVGSTFKFVIPQEVSLAEPIVNLDNIDDIAALIYVNMEQFHMLSIRDAYTNNLKNIVKNLGVNGHFCRNINELKRRVDLGSYNFIFITPYEYRQDEEYFNRLAKEIRVVVAYDEFEEYLIHSDDIVKFYKPYYIATVVEILQKKNGSNRVGIATKNEAFFAPTAKVLVVDDNVMNLKVAGAFLAKYKVQVEYASSGPEALDKIESKDFDFVFMDHMMPEMDGVETVRRIRNKHGRYFQEVPIVALTANNVPGAKEMFLNNGFNSFVSKPIDKAMIELVLNEFIPSKKKEANTISAVQEEPNDPRTNANSFRTEESIILQNQTVNDQLNIPGLNIDTGIKFCGSKEDLLDVLKLNVSECQNTIDKIMDAYVNGDCKNYAVHVHGLKSSMKMIGSMDVSNMAKELESAAKNNDVTLIEANTADMISAYKQQIEDIAKVVCPSQNPFEEADKPESEKCETNASEQLEEITEAEIARLLSRFEVAVYTFDPDVMKATLDEVSGKSKGGVSLQEILQPVYNKINMSDFMAGNDLLASLLQE